MPRMIEAARGYAAAARPKMVAASLDDVHEVMGRELRRLKALAEINDHVRPEEIERVEAETEALEAAIRAADIRLDALRLIWKTSEY